jgi:hypothetical protein
MKAATVIAAAILLAFSSSVYACRSQIDCASGIGNKQVQIQVNSSVSRPACEFAETTTREPDSGSADERMRRAYYELASKECDVLLATIAAKCSLVNISVSGREYSSSPGQPPMVDESLNATLSIELK